MNTAHRWITELGSTVVAISAVMGAAWSEAGPYGAFGRWTREELEVLQSLWLGSLEPLGPDPSNRYADDPRAVELGHRLFFDTRLSANGAVSCATCHLPERQFQDGARLGIGVDTTDRRTMPIAGTAHSPWFFWDGRKDSQWSQALGPLESPAEHGADRTFCAHVVAEHYRPEYEALFGPLPELAGLPARAGPVADPAARGAWMAMSPDDREAVTRVYVNLGKAIAAYERRLQPGLSRFDRFVEAALSNDEAGMGAALTPDEEAGLRTFIGKGRCINCHNGPLFTDNGFHNTGVPAVPGMPEDPGRAAGARQVLADEFNCTSPYSDAGPSDCAELRFMRAAGDQLVRAFKTPTLRGAAERAPYMHAGQLATLLEVIAHYDRAPKAPAGRSELKRLRLSREERVQLEAFLRSLSGPLTAPTGLLGPPAESTPRSGRPRSPAVGSPQ